MKIGIIQASSQKDKNKSIENCLRNAVPKEHKIFNFGIYEDSAVKLSYIQIALCAGLLLESKSIDFIITGCSSGQGMMLACNSFSGVLCGYAANVTDAFLFGRINNGNAISYPLGTHWGWAAEINLRETLKALFSEPLGIGYPPDEAERKKHDSEQLKQIQRLCKKDISEMLPLLDRKLVKGALHYDTVSNFIMEHGSNERLKAQIQEIRSNG